ncbi:MAG: ATP-grasp domain-containing protein [Sandaracinaceae bacterium]|nr:ATP-grasp domain-containing protein [Sandaracinaceae bacterium]
MDEPFEFRPIHKLLIANRGEIASRIQRTCRAMGIETVAVYSDADADAPFVRSADEAVRLGPPPSRESYLNVEAILDAAARTGADAVHPGFGFLAENADFAQAVIDRGLVFVGPRPDAIRAMGSKQRAKQIARDAGVPVIEGYDGADQDALFEEARRIGFPVLVKASAGGGGKGMRIVRDERELRAAIDGARREAASSFGDPTLLVEKYVERPRHIEIQILGDQHGGLVHLFERECSIQRRHQKIIEEAPSLAVGDALRRLMGEAALKLARAIGYTNAGTVEMILDPDGAFYFLEVNTRLQVEHPVTEAITDVDLVELQIRVARGEPLPFDQEMIDTVASGAAIECRLYAEDPAKGFLPQSGRLVDFTMPAADWLRVDAGVEPGSEVSPYYDPMLAKVITWGNTRGDAIARMCWALRRASVLGITTNRDFLIDVLEHEAFVAGDLHTHFIEEHFAAPAPRDAEVTRRAAVAAALAGWAARPRTLPSMRTGYRNNPFADQEVAFLADEREHVVRYVHHGGDAFTIDGAPARAWVDGATVTVVEQGHRWSARVVRDGPRAHVVCGGRTVALDEAPRFPDLGMASAADATVAPMPGKIIKLLVAPGDVVSVGQTLAIMEAMKMEHSIGAPHDGVVAEVCVAEGDQVAEGAVLAIVREPGAHEAENDAADA